MTDITSLTTLLGQNERQRDEALAAHQRALTTSEAARAQAEQLFQYQRDYEARWRDQFSRGCQIEVVRHYHSFMERLTQAVEQQARVAEHAALQVDLALAGVRDAEMRCASVRKLIERRLHDIRIGTERREQKQSDEHASRVAWNQATAGHPRPNR